MIHLINTTAKYLVIIFMALYVVKCFTYFTARSKKKRDHNLRMQVAYIFVIHFLCHVCLLLNEKKPVIFVYYLVEITIAIIYILVFHKVYRSASRLLTNNIAFLMLIGYTMLLRLGTNYAVRQFALATVGLFITSFIPAILGHFKKLRANDKFYGIAGIVALLLVFVPGIGMEIYGSRNWIGIAGKSLLQPMEFVKIIFIIFVAASLVKVERMKHLMSLTVFAFIYLLVLAAEKDFGALLIFYVTYIMMVYLATSRASFVILGFGLAAVGIVGVYMLFKDSSLFSHIMVRVHAWQNPFKYQQSEGYQVSESLFAIGTGGFTGSGLGNGMPDHIPVAESDFIFAAICEELGVIFGLCLILIYISSFISIANVAMKCRDPFYKYVAFGISITYIVQVFLNIGGVIKFIPSTGVTLPLISYGLSSVFSTLIMFSIVQFIYIFVSKEAEKTEDEKERLQREEYERQVIQREPVQTEPEVTVTEYKYTV